MGVDGKSDALWARPVLIVHQAGCAQIVSHRLTRALPPPNDVQIYWSYLYGRLEHVP
jgi:hypothetical protein